MKKGISLIALSATIMILLILISTITISGVKTVENSKKTAFASEIYTIQKSVDSYVYANSITPASEEVKLNISKVKPESKKQFDGETISGNEVTLNVLDYDKLGITDLQRGNKKDGDTDIYLVSKTTNRVYYAKGIKFNNYTHYTLNQELLDIIKKNNVGIVSKSKIIYTLLEPNYTNSNTQLTIKIPKEYTLNNVKFDNVLVSNIYLGIQDNYKLYTSEVSKNGKIEVNYNSNKQDTFYITNIDKSNPILIVGEQEVIEGKNYLNFVSQDFGGSKIKTIKYASGKDLTAAYFQTSGQEVNGNKVQITEDMEYITLYVEDYAGNYNCYAANGTAAIDPSQNAVNVGDYIVGYSAGPAGMVYGDDEEAEKWRVLWNTDTSGNTKLEIIPTKSVRDVTLGFNDPKAPVEKQDGGFEQAKWSYLNAIKTINEYSEDYINSVYADSARGLGSDRANPTNKEVVDFTISSSMSFPVAVTEESTQTFYEADLDQLQDVVEINGFNENVWVSSRYVPSFPSNVSFNVRYLNTWGVVSGSTLCYVNSSGSASGYVNYSRPSPCSFSKI